MSTLHTLHQMVLDWARDNGFGEPCGCGGMCAHQRFSAGSPDRSARFEEAAKQMHDEFGHACPKPFVRYYFWVGAVSGTDTLDNLNDKLLPLAVALKKEGAAISIQCLAKCGVEFTPTRLPCETTSLSISDGLNSEKCHFCELPFEQHVPRRPGPQLPN